MILNVLMKVLAALGDVAEGAPYIPLNIIPLGPGLLSTAGSLVSLEEEGLRWMVLMNFLFMSEVTICSRLIIWDAPVWSMISSMAPTVVKLM